MLANPFVGPLPEPAFFEPAFESEEGLLGDALRVGEWWGSWRGGDNGISRGPLGAGLLAHACTFLTGRVAAYWKRSLDLSLSSAPRGSSPPFRFCPKQMMSSSSSLLVTIRLICQQKSVGAGVKLEAHLSASFDCFFRFVVCP